MIYFIIIYTLIMTNLFYYIHIFFEQDDWSNMMSKNQTSFMDEGIILNQENTSQLDVSNGCLYCGK
jgi:hypothetical protein